MSIVMTRVYLLYCLSGFVSLGYQVAWFRIYVDQFGCTNLTFALVLCNFIGGLGLGSLASKRTTDLLATFLKIKDQLRVYGVVELLVTVFVLLTLLAKRIPADILGTFPYQWNQGIYQPSLSYQLFELSVATICLFVPCFFMGVTFPFLCQVYRDKNRFPSALYAWNTLGACSGVLACQFVLLPEVGHDQSFRIMIGLNLLIGVFFLMTGGAPHLSPQATEASRATKRNENSSSRLQTGPQGLSVLLTCAVLSGLLSGALEADMFKRLDFLGGNSGATMSFVSFWAILGIFLASWMVRTLHWIRLWHIKIAFVLGVICYSIAWQFAYPLRKWLLLYSLYAFPEFESVQENMLVFFPATLSDMLWNVGTFVFPIFLCFSLLLPYVCNRIHKDQRHLGLAYGTNTLAFCLGMMAFTWIAPAVNVFYSLKLVMVLLVIGTALLFTISEHKKLAGWKLFAAAGAFAVGCLLTPRTFDRSYVYPDSPAAKHPVRAMKSNSANTTYVVADPNGQYLYFNNYSMSATNFASRVYMRLMAHFPLLAQPHPERALLIGFGVGNTASAIAKHETIQQIDIVELNDKVVETAPEFATTNDKVYADPRVRWIHDDGRKFLNVTDERYDLVTSEPPPPMHPGIYRLYSKEYYQQVLSHLSRQGMMTQWLPIYQMPQEAVDLAITTFIEVFPHALLFVGFEQELILLGSRSPIELRYLQERFNQSQHVAADLKQLRIEKPISLIARVIKGDATLRRQYAGRRVISDQHNDLAHLFLNPRTQPRIPYNPLEVLADLELHQLAVKDELHGVLTHLGRLQYCVNGFPATLLMQIRSEELPGVALADVDWKKIERMFHEYSAARKAGRSRDAVRWLEESLAITAELPNQLLALAQCHFTNGRYSEAVVPLQRFRKIEPNETAGDLLLAWALIRLKKHKQATEILQELIRKEPQNAQAYLDLGIVYQIQGNLNEAVSHYRQALQYDSQLALAHTKLGDLYQSQRRIDRAIHHYEQALSIDPNSAQLREKLQELIRLERQDS